MVSVKLSEELSSEETSSVEIFATVKDDEIVETNIEGKVRIPLCFVIVL